MSKTLNDIIASVIPQELTDEPAKCPECGGRLTTTITLYTPTNIYVQRWSDGTRRVRYKGDLPETKKALAEQAQENYSGAEVDERDELRCENEGCDYWCRPTDIEFPRLKGK